MRGIGGVQTSDGSSPPADLLSALGRALQHRGSQHQSRYMRGGTGLLQADAPALTRSAPTLRAGLAPAQCDPLADRVVLERDVFGLKPLYYAESPCGLIFASEPRAILATGPLEPQLCAEALGELMQLQFMTGRRTLFSGIERVLPGERIVAERGKVVERRRVPATPQPAPADLSDGAVYDRLESLLTGAIEINLQGISRWGLLFDGLIESCALAAALRRTGHRGFPLFTLVPDGPFGAHNAELARCMARTCDGEAVLVDLSAEHFFELLPKVVACLDDPGSDYFAVGLFRLAAEAAGSVDALVSNAGGNVLFGGLGRYRSALRPLWLGGRSMRARGFLEGLGVLREDAPSWRDGLRASESRLAERRLTPLQALQALDCIHWLPNNVMPVLDRCLYAHSIEPRAPYLEPALAAFAFALPNGMKVSATRGSLILRRWLERVLPDAEPFARHRPPPIPITRWLGERALRLAPLVAAAPGLAPLCHPEAVRGLFERLSVRPSKHLGQAAWQLLFFALWHRIHIEGRLGEGSVWELLS